MCDCSIKFRITDTGYLEVSYDKECTWEQIGKVKGDASTQAGPQGPQGPVGPRGAAGTNGTNGVTPYISQSTGNWVVNGVDTGIKAAGSNGTISVEASQDIATVGTPNVTTRTVNNELIIQFHQLKGAPGVAPTITATRDGNTVYFKIDGVTVAQITDGIVYAEGTHIDIAEGNVLNCTLTAGKNITINSNDEIDCDVPTVKHELIYSDDNENLTTHQLLYQEALVVDNDDDFTECTRMSDVETDILNSWHQFALASQGISNPIYSPEYGNGTYIPGSTDYPATGYGMWYTDANGKVLNEVNSGDFNGYMIPRDKLSFFVESLIGTDIGNTTGDQIGICLINDSNAAARRFSTENGVYYRNTLYDIYPAGTTSSTRPKRPQESAWVKEDLQNNTAKVIYTTSPTSSNASEAFPTGTVNVYSIANIKTAAGRRTRVAAGTETVVANSSHAASGYIGMLTVVITNSSSMELTQLSGSHKGTIFVFGSIYDIATKSWKNTTIINGDYDDRNSGNYWDKGYWLVPYDYTKDTQSSDVTALIKNSLSFKNGILTLKFSNPVFYSASANPSYNGSELTINFKTRKYDFTSYIENGTHVKDTKTGIDLPTFTCSGVTDISGTSVTPDLWGMFVGGTKFAYNAFSYNNLYMKCLDVVLDNLVFYVDKTSTKYGVWKLNAARTAYEKQTIAGGAYDDPLYYFNGSRQSYNTITKKLFYNDGASIYRISTSGNEGTVNNGTLTIKGDLTTAQTFSANEVSNKELNLISGVGINIVADGNGSVTINKDIVQCVLKSKDATQIITPSKSGDTQPSAASGTKLYGYIAGLVGHPNSAFHTVNLDEFYNAAGKIANPDCFEYTKNAGETGKYIGILGTGATAGRLFYKLELISTATSTKETHYIGAIIDTPSCTTFFFVSTLNSDWDIVCRQNSNNLYAYLQVPNSFVGVIKVYPLGHKYESGGNCWIYRAASATTSINTGNGTPYQGSLLVSSDMQSGSLDPNDTVSPYGKYHADLLLFLGADPQIGDLVAISDTQVFAQIITAQSNAITTLSTNYTALEARVAALEGN